MVEMGKYSSYYNKNIISAEYKATTKQRAVAICRMEIFFLSFVARELFSIYG